MTRTRFTPYMGKSCYNETLNNNVRVRQCERGNESFDSKRGGGGDFFTSWMTVSFSRTLPNRVTCYLVDIAFFHVLNRIVRNDIITTSVY
jgi:hypothetical protein